MKNVAMELAPYVNINAGADPRRQHHLLAIGLSTDGRVPRADGRESGGAPGDWGDCAQTVLFLAGPESDFFYGQIIPLAGGWTV
jgi:2-keto-3-deoxy-L-fuconate dehydrogenase